MELPVLYVHGALVWKVLLVLLVMTTCAAIAALRSWRARRRARRAIASLVPTELHEGDVVLRGKIVQGSASTLTQELSQTSERTSGLVIVHEGERIVIEGDVKVTHGSRARRWWLRPPRLIAAKWCWSHVHDAVLAGDEVIASGTLARVPDVAGYRDSASRWEMTGNPVTIAARVPQAKAPPLGLGRWVIGIALFGGIWYGVLHHAGVRALERARSVSAVQSEIAPRDALAIAAAMPGSRDEAFKLLSDRLARSFEKTERAFQLRLRLEEQRGRCPAYALYQASRFEEAVAAARRCDPDLEKHALLFAGHYREAGARARPASKIAALAAIAEGRWSDAAPYVDEAVKDFESRTPASPVTEEDLHRWAAEARCIAALFRAWGGDARGFAATDDRIATCIAVRALAEPIAARGEALSVAAAQLEALGRDEWSWIRKARQFATAYGVAGPRHALTIDSFGPGRWLVPFVLETHAVASPYVRAHLHQERAWLEVERGDLAAADRENRRAIELGENQNYHPPRSTVALLTTAAPVPAHDVPAELDDAAEIRSGVQVEQRHLIAAIHPDSCRPRYASAIEDARNGDGRALAAVHRRCHVFAITPTVLFAVLPLVEKGRSELAAALRLHRPDPVDYAFPFHFLERTWWVRDISRMVGDAREYQRWRAIHDRHAAVLADREKLIAIMLLNEVGGY